MNNKSQTITQRSEIVFIYDVTDANPNGDPMDENKPRIDEETEINIVTDVRLKRTIRDYLRTYRNQNIFIQAEEVIEKDEVLLKSRGAKLGEELCILLDNDKTWTDLITEDEGKKIREKIYSLLKVKGKPKRKEAFIKCLVKKEKNPNKEEVFKKFEEARTRSIKTALLSKYIDLRLFGATLAVANITIQETGPIQFKFGRSMHKVDTNFYKGSITMPVESAKDYELGKKQAEFSEEYRLPYSLISFYGVVNENQGKKVGVTERDVEYLMDGLWNGTKNLITRSKFGQMPRFLLRVIHKEKNFHIGDLDRKIMLVTKKKEKNEKEIRCIDELILNISRLITSLKANKEKIDRVEIVIDDDVCFKLESEGEEISAREVIGKLNEAIKNDNKSDIFTMIEPDRGLNKEE